MLASQSNARSAVCRCPKQLGSRRILVVRAQQHDREPLIRKVAPVLLSAGLALGLLLATPTVAEARIRPNLKQQREEQERLYAEQMKKLDAVLEQQIKAKKAAEANSTPEAGAAAKSTSSAGKKSS